jgi:hypothetical protein
MGPFEGVVYALCTGTSGFCTWLLVRAYLRSRSGLLAWSGICFLLLTVNNLLVFTDIIILPASIDLSIPRYATSLAAACVLVFGFVWGV